MSPAASRNKPFPRSVRASAGRPGFVASPLVASAAYAALGSAWVLFSDPLIADLVSGLGDPGRVQGAKGQG